MGKSNEENPRAWRWCFTINRYSAEEEFFLMFDLEPIKYIVYGHEVGLCGTPHLQGYIECSYNVRLSTIVRWRGFERAHIEQAFGTAEQNRKYCTKTDPNFFECGTIRPTRQGHRRDLDDVRRLAHHEGMRSVVPWANYQQIRCAEKYLEYYEAKRTWVPEVIWLHGPTGVGKSRWAHEAYPDAYTKSDSSKWWNGYDGHREVIWDDFRDNDVMFNDLLRLLDRYECRVETKGGMRQFIPRTIVITSNSPPDKLYNNVQSERKDQLLRRISKIVDMSNQAGQTFLPAPADLAEKSGGVIVSPPSSST